MSTKNKLKTFIDGLSESDAKLFMEETTNALAAKANCKIVKANPKVDKAVGGCLQTDNDDDRQLVNGVFTNLLSEMGEREAVNLLEDMDRKGIRLISVIHHLQHGNDGDVLKIPEMKFRNPLDRVEQHLKNRYGPKKAAEKLRSMSAEQIILLNDKLKAAKANESDDGSLRLPPLFDFEEEKKDSDVLELPQMDFNNK